MMMMMMAIIDGDKKQMVCSDNENEGRKEKDGLWDLKLEQTRRRTRNNPLTISTHLI